MAINISIYASVKKLFVSQCFQQKYINNFDVLTFMRTVLTDKKFTSGNDYTHKKSKLMWVKKFRFLSCSKSTK